MRDGSFFHIGVGIHLSSLSSLSLRKCATRTVLVRASFEQLHLAFHTQAVLDPSNESSKDGTPCNHRKLSVQCPVENLGDFFCFFLKSSRDGSLLTSQVQTG